MKSDENIDEILDRYWTSASREAVESNCDRVLQRLRARADHAASPRIEEHATNLQRPSSWRRAASVIAAAAALLAVWIGITWRPDAAPATVKGTNDSLYRLIDGNARVLRNGATLGSGETVRAAAGALLKLADGSGIELRSNAEIRLERADDGIRILLTNGSLIVNAVRQPGGGHLYVQTKDMTVSVVGTVFLVNAEAEGTRVAVLEGAVRVQQRGGPEKKLLPGEQAATNPLMKSQPVREEISWSRNAYGHLALLQQFALPPPLQIPPERPVAFEVASVRRSDSGSSGRRGGPDGGNHTTGPCTNGASQIDPRRFVALNNTLYTLIELAYGMGNCLATFNRLSGGPGWIRSDRFDVEALMPEGSPSYTVQQFHKGEAPELQMMLQELLAERFKLVMHREMKELPVYSLQAAKGGPKLKPWKEGDFPDFRTGMAAPGTIEGTKAPMADLANMLSIVTGRPVVDRTGIVGEFNYGIQFAPLDSNFFTIPTNPAAASRPSLFTVLEEKLGLQLGTSRGPVEVWVIDSVEKPSEN